MTPQLATDHRELEQILKETVAVAGKYLARQSDLPPGLTLSALVPGSLPEKGLGAKETLKKFERDLAPLLANTAGPRYFGFVTGGSTPASIAGDWLVSTYDQNACGSFDSVAPMIEHETIGFLRELIGINDKFFGSFVTGATMSNVVGLALARQWFGEQYDLDFSKNGIIGSPEIPVISATPHSSVLKALSILGIGKNALRYVRTLPDREAVDIDALEEQLRLTEHAIVVANAGTVNTVDFDDLKAIAALRKKYSFWLHVDAAFGGFAGASEKYKHLIRGIDEADSITVDAHKWLNVPYDAAMQFTRRKDLQLKVFQNAAAYLSNPEESPDFFHYTPENSRRFRALPAWFSLMAYGRSGHAEIVERNCQLAKQLGDEISNSPALRLLAPVRMNVVCFTLQKAVLRMDHVKEFLSRVTADGRVFFTPTLYKGIPAIRAAISNWQTTENDIKIAVTVLHELTSTD